MQTLWSRAARLPTSCRCTSCFSPQTALARRATTATTRRRLKVGDAFTVFYSAIFATAAVVDAKWKEARRKELNRKMEDALSDLELKKESVLSGGEHTYSIWDGYMEKASERDEIYRYNYRSQYQRPWADVWETAEDAELELELLSRHCSEMLGGPSSLNKSRRMGDAERNSIRDDRTGVEDPLSESSIRELERQVANMVLRLLYQSTAEAEFQRKYVKWGLVDRSSNVTDEDKDSFFKAVRRRFLLLVNGLKSLSNGSFGSHRYPKYASLGLPELRGIQYQVQEQLYKHIDFILRRSCMGGEDMENVVAKICHLILVSTAPPEVETYNILIKYLTRLRRNELVKIVFDTMVETKQIPNEVTISSLLKFFTASNDRESFRNLLKLVAEDNQDCNALPDIVRRNDVIFGSAIAGAIKLGMVEDAQRWYRDMVREGWAPNTQILTSILQSCILSNDWCSGWQIWLKLKKLWRSSPTSELIAWNAYNSMLKLCRQCNRKDEFEDVFKEALGRGINALRPAPKDKGLPIPNKEKLPSSETIRRVSTQRLAQMSEEKISEKRKRRKLIIYHSTPGISEEANPFNRSHPRQPTQSVEVDLHTIPSGA